MAQRNGPSLDDISTHLQYCSNLGGRLQDGQPIQVQTALLTMIVGDEADVYWRQICDSAR
jgi:hypothetical protein